MGMFDYLTCRVPLPVTDVPPPAESFQTKDTPEQYMAHYTINQGGLLTVRRTRIERDPDPPEGSGHARSVLASLRGWRSVYEEGIEPVRDMQPGR